MGSAENPANLAEWLAYVKRHESAIYVREQEMGGKWVHIRLVELSPERWGHHVGRMLDKGILPAYVREG